MKGKVCQWRDEKGFGFIQPENGTEKVFFHVSSVKTTARRPEVGDVVLYDTTRDAQNRLRAKAVVIENISNASVFKKQNRHAKIDPPRKNAIDYLSILIILASLPFAAFKFYVTNSIESSWFYAVPAVLAFFILSRQRKPAQKTFSCARCRKISEFDSRTIQAWNNGFVKLYCRDCHHKWLENRPKQEHIPNRNAGGCLGATVLLILVPTFCVAGIYQWLM